MKNELGEILNKAREERLAVGATVIKHIKRKAKSESSQGSQLKAFLQAP